MFPAFSSICTSVDAVSKSYVATAYILHRSGANDLNTRSAYLHMLGDLFSSVVIIIGGVFVWYYDWLFIDPLLSAVVAVLVFKWSCSLLYESLHILLEGKPKALDIDHMKTHLKKKMPQTIFNG